MTVMTGHSRRNGNHFGWYLLRTEDGQTVAVREVVGLMGDHIKGWFEQMEAMAQGSSAENYFYHFTLNPREGEAYTDAQLKFAVATALENLGLEDQPYFVVEHGGKAERPPHYHGIVLRIDLETGKAISDSNNYAIHMRTADELEKAFGHESTPRGRGPRGPNPKDHEVHRGKDAERPVKLVESELRALWGQSDSPLAFAAALEEHGFILAEGTRGLCIVDPAGKEHSLYRRLGLRKKELDPRMEAIRDDLPSVPEARAGVRERGAGPTTPGASRAAEGSGPRAASPEVSASPRQQETPPEPPAGRHSLDHPAAEAPLDPVERFGRDLMATMREGPSVPLSADSERWGDQMTEAMHANAGSDGLTFWERSIARLAVMRDRVAGWVRGAWQDLVSRFATERDPDGPDRGIER